MVSTSKTFGFKTLGPFYVISQMLGLLLVREIDKKVLCSKRANDSGSGVSGAVPKLNGVFKPDRRWLAYSMLMMLLFYWIVRRCASLVGDWSCSDSSSCSSDIEWIVSTAGAAQAMVSLATAAAHRLSSTAHLLNYAYNVLSHDANDRVIGGPLLRRQRVFTVAGTYATVTGAVVLVRSVAVVVARPNRFSILDILLLCLPSATVTIVVECAIVCVCAAAEDTCHDVVRRLQNIALDAARSPAAGRQGGRRPMHWLLEAAWRDHWRGCQLVDGLSTCYGLDLAVNLTASMLFFVVYAYVTLISVYSSYAANENDSTTSHNNPNSDIYWNIALACQLLCVSFRIVFISYQAERIKQVAVNSVLISLRNILKNNNLDISTIMLINSFTYQIMNRELKVSACGFFSVNLSFFHALIRLATTYLIVIIQYNSEPLKPVE